MRRGLVALIIFVSFGSFVACSPQTAQNADYEVVSPASIKPGDPLPAPKESPILTVSGAIRDKEVKLDLPTIQAVGVVSYTLPMDPYAERQVIYNGVLLSTLLDVVGAEASAKTLHLVALDDYSVDIKIEDVRRWPIMMAFSADGKLVPVAEKGPLMIVFPYHAYEFDRVIYNPQWIWQLAKIEVRSE